MPEPPAAFAGVGPDTLSYSRVDDLAAVRGFVRARSQALGLPPERVGTLLVAVSELATNTLRHTAGGGRVRVFAEPGFVVCDVVDSGPPREFGREMPAPDAVSGRGLAIVERKDFQYLYPDGDDFVFMDLETYEQITVPSSIMGSGKDYLVEGSTAQIAMHEGVPISVDLPASLVLTITKCDPGVKGDTARGGGDKPAVLETGAEVRVPLFVNEGDSIKVDTRIGEYVSRA